MSILSSKERIIPNPLPEVLKPQKVTRGDVKELLGKEFRLIKNGLDPDEVIDFLESVAGSSEVVLKRLEHFSALQKASQTMELMMAEVRQLKDRIKEQAEREAIAEKEQIIAEADEQANEIIEEGKHQSAEMMKQTKNVCISSIEDTNTTLFEAKRRLEELLDRTRKSYLATVDDTNAILMEGILKAREIQELAFQKAKDVAFKNAGSLREDIQSIADDMQNNFNALFNQFTGPPADEPAPVAEPLPNEGLREVDSVEPGDVESIAAPITEEEPVASKSGEEKEFASIRNSPLLSEVNRHSYQYKGEVTLVVPQGVGESWMQQLRQRLVSIPNTRVHLESGDHTGRTMMTLFFSEPVALPAILLDIPGVEDVIEEDEPKLGHNSGNGTSQHASGKERKTLMVLLSRNN